MLYTNKSIDPSVFQWPEYSSETERIRINSKKYADKTILESFIEEYNLDIDTSNSQSINNIPSEIRIGDVIKLRILDINKGKVIFDTGNYKNLFECAVNLYKYDRFKKFIPKEPINLLVTNKIGDRVVVDPIAYLFKEWEKDIKDNIKKQKHIINPKTIHVKDLQLSTGGFIGKAVIPNVSEFIGEDYTISTFIPGSQIVLNITKDFEQFIGKDVDAFIINYVDSNVNKTSLICSVKSYLAFIGQLEMIDLFKEYCEDSPRWKEQLNHTYEGVVTGVLNSQKKCGVFIEIPEMNITGMFTTEPYKLVNYKPRMEVPVHLVGFDEKLQYNPITKQMTHADPYIIEDNILYKCNIKPVFEIAEL